MISHEHRCIFVHIPKTAGNSVNRVFGVGWEDHKDLQRYHEEVAREQFESYFKFAIVRNPWDRLLSDYNYQLKKSRAPSSKLFVFAADGSKRNFAEWVETALAAPDRYEAGEWGGSVSPHINRWTPQIDWISVDGQPRTDFVARLERLPEDFRAVCRRVGLPSARLPHRNRRLHWHYSHYYDRTTRDLVAAYYARDIEEFGYEFDHAFLRIAFNWPSPRRLVESALAAEPSTASDATDPGPTEANEPSVPRRPHTRGRAWPRQPLFAAVAGLMVVLGIFGASLPAAPLARENSALPQSVRHFIERSATAPAGYAADNIFARARRFSNTMAELDLHLEIVPFAASGALVTFAPEPMDESQGLGSTISPVTNSSRSGSAPRWWVRRQRENSDD